MTDRELMKQALDALEYASDQTKPENLNGCDCLICTTILALRDRLAQPEQEPRLTSIKRDMRQTLEDAIVRAIHDMANEQEPETYREGILVGPCFCRKWPGGVPPTRKPLQDMAVFDLADQHMYDGGKNYGILAFARAIEAAHGIKP